jgi:bacterial/archaeal transporter family-2 protein
MAANNEGGKTLNKTFYYLLAFGVGLVIAAHLSMNADVGQKIGNARAANAVFWSIGALVAVVIWLASPDRSAVSRLKDVNPLLLLAGALGAALVLALAIIIPKLGAGNTNVTLLAGQVIAGVLISHFALWSSPQESITVLKMLGVAVMVGGAYMAVAL